MRRIMCGVSAGWDAAIVIASRGVSGLTLVELLIAMMILVTMTMASAVIFRSSARAWRTGELRTERYQQARLLSDLFEREVTSCVANTRYPFIGVRADSGTTLHQASVFDELWFVGTLPGRTGLVERGYWVDARGRLMCHDQEPADGDPATGESELCGQDVSAFDVTYFDGQQWLRQWDGRPDTAQAGTLPKAIHLSVTLGRQNPERFETIVHIPTS